VVKVEVDPGEVGALIDRGYLAPKDRDDLEVLAAAVTAFFSDDAVTAAFWYGVTPSQTPSRLLLPWIFLAGAF
jgi:hypothetical protein